MVASFKLVDRHLASGALCRVLFDFCHTHSVLLFSFLILFLALLFLLTAALIKLCASLTDVKRHIVYCADTKATSNTAEDVAFRAVIVDLARSATLREAVAEIWISAEAGDHGELVELRPVLAICRYNTSFCVPCEQIRRCILLNIVMHYELLTAV